MHLDRFLGFLAGNRGLHSSQDWSLRPFPNTLLRLYRNNGKDNGNYFLAFRGRIPQVVESLPSQDSAARGPDGNSQLHDRKQWLCMAYWAILAH